MRQRHQLNVWSVYADQLLLILGTFLLISALLIIIPHAKKSQDGIKPKAEYLVVLSWDDKRNVDLDLWLHHDGCIVSFLTRECPNISLDRDSRGYISNKSQLPDGSIVISPNQEVTAIRAIMPGDYLTAVNYYDSPALGHSVGEGPIDAHLELYRLNPTVTVVSKIDLHFDTVRQTINAFNFHVAEDGSITMLPLPPETLFELYVK